MMLRVLCTSIALMVLAGCSSKPQVFPISGSVTFKDKPVPAGYITLTPDVSSGTLGQTVGFQIKDGTYDSVAEGVPGVAPGTYKVVIAGFDGVKIPMYGQGKQIFNPIEDAIQVKAEPNKKDFVVPASAGENVKIQPTADS